MINPNLTAIVIAKNEEEMIDGCLQTLSWCHEIIVVDDGSIDRTAEIVESFGAKLISFKSNSFKRLREEAVKQVKTDWILYIDADERVSPLLAKEISVNIETQTAEVLEFRRRNVNFGEELLYGGWQNDWVTRVFKVTALKGWFGDVHESPIYSGNAKKLNATLLHLTHRNTVSGLLKSAAWTPIEARELVKKIETPVTLTTLFRKFSMEFIRRAVIQKGYKDGMPGMIEAITQAINKLLIYIQVWELQQQPNLADKYTVLEKKVILEWEKNS